MLPEALRSRGVLVALILGVTVIALAPHPSSLLAERRTVGIPFDTSLRLPFGASFLGTAATRLRPGDRLRAVQMPGGGFRLPRSRAELDSLVDAVPPGSALQLHVVRGRAEIEVAATVKTVSPLRTLAAQWPLILAAILFLLFGCVVAAGSAHPVALPILSVSWCVAVAVLSDLDLVLPWDRGLVGIADLRPRLGALGLAMLPASVLHLAMRFPVVAPSFRSSSAAVMPYVVFTVPAAFGQARLDDAGLANGLERILIGLSLVCAAVLVAASVTRAAQMTPIERARTRALAVGVVLGLALPVVFFATGGRPEAWSGAPVALSLLAIPGCVSWAIVRYRLLDPTAWLRRTVVGSIQAVASLLAATFAVSGLTRGPLAPAEAEAVGAVGLLTVAIYEGTRLVLRRTSSVRRESIRARQVLEEATKRLASTRDRRAVLAGVVEVLRETIRPAAIALVQADAAGAASDLAIDGISLWRSLDSPTHRVVVRRSRAEDPSPTRAELVAPIAPASAGIHLLVLSAREDGLPFGAEDEAALLGVVHIAATALDASATTEELERRVAEKTASLGRAVADRDRMLETAGKVACANQAADVLDALIAFVGGSAVHAHWASTGATRHALGTVELPSGSALRLAAPALLPERTKELAPQVQTLCAFAHLAIARLELLIELKREVERQAVEIAEIRSKRKHAEFVRGVAHELRKPTEEVRRLLDELPPTDEGEPVREKLSRLKSLSHELGRRLDLLLFHSGVRLKRTRVDLVSLISEALTSVRGLRPDRTFNLASALPRLPVVADPSRLLSVIENLLDNAAKATRAGQSITVRTGLEHRGPEGVWVRFEVEDEGIGISPEHLDRVYEPGVTFAPDGVGLGLSLCREIVRLHGGSIAAESQPGRTVFRVTLPQLPTNEEEAGP